MGLPGSGDLIVADDDRGMCCRHEFIVTPESLCADAVGFAFHFRMAMKDNNGAGPANWNRRRFVAGLSLLPLAMGGGQAAAQRGSEPLMKGRGLLISSTTVAGKQSLEHAELELRQLFRGVENILLINFASLPAARDAYAKRMQRDFSRIEERLKVTSLHAVPHSEAGGLVEKAEAFFVSGGNTFLLLRELLDRGVLDTIRERVASGVPYAGSSAGSNLAGTAIGTTNDFPLVDIPSRRAIGLLPGCYNPHHPDPSDKDAFGSRQWKIGQYAAYHPSELVFGVNNAGMISVDGEQLSLRGSGAVATVQLGSAHRIIDAPGEANVSAAVAELRQIQQDKVGESR